MDLTIRAATIQDYDALCALFAQVDRIHYTNLPDIFQPVPGAARERSHIESILDDSRARLFVAEQDGTVIGLAEATIRDAARWPMATPRSWVHLHDIIVDERFRGVGVGKALLAHVEAWARSLGISRVELVVWEFNTPARALYEHQGFRTLNRTMCKDIDG
jgi:GNAT superfamily N-acetyltransferase